MRTITIEIDYPGAVISINHYKYRGGIYTRKEAKQWMEQLGWLVKPYHLEDWKLPLTIKCSGVFKDKRSQPDMSNLSKCILDAIEDCTGVNDRNMKWIDGNVSYGNEPKLIIEIKEIDVKA